MDTCTRLLAELVKVGVNVNWLVFGQGEMLVVDMLDTERLKLEATFWKADSNLLRATLNLVFDQVSKEEGRKRAINIFEQACPHLQISQRYPFMPEPEYDDAERSENDPPSKATSGLAQDEKHGNE